MNDIVLKTTTDNYLASDMVFGCVYVKIELPTAANGVTLKFSGYENYYYNFDIKNETSQCDRVIQDSFDHIKHKTIQLYKSDDAIRFGDYMFPFRLKLPERIPGSFYCKDKNWEVSVVYKLEAELTGSEDIADSKEIIVHDTNILCKDKASSIINLRGKLPLLTATLSADVFIDKSTYDIGDTAKLCIEFASRGMFTPEIKCIKISLCQELLLNLKDNQEIANQQITLKQEIIWQNYITNDVGINLIKGLKKYMVPLWSTEVPLMQTSFGKHIFCSHQIHINISLGKSEMTLSLPIKYIRKPVSSKDEEPVWAVQCHIPDDKDYKDLPDAELYESLPCVQQALKQIRSSLVTS